MSTDPTHLVPLGPQMSKQPNLHGLGESTSCPGIMKATPQAGAEPGGGGICREASHSRWEAEPERDVLAMWHP